jgi:hypothetical protein
MARKSIDQLVQDIRAELETEPSLMETIATAAIPDFDGSRVVKTIGPSPRVHESIQDFHIRNLILDWALTNV